MKKETVQNIKDEYLDLVDKDDNVVGKKLRSEVYNEGLNNYRVVNAFIVNSKEELWIPRRTADKKIFSLCLDMSLAEHVQSGETYGEALERGLKEELNLELSQMNCRVLGHLSPLKDNVSCFMTVYEFRMNRAPNYNKKDFTEYFWLTPKTFFEKINKGDKSKDDLPKLVKMFYQHEKYKN